jgi:hypothetical protein
VVVNRTRSVYTIFSNYLFQSTKSRLCAWPNLPVKTTPSQMTPKTGFYQTSNMWHVETWDLKDKASNTTRRLKTGRTSARGTWYWDRRGTCLNPMPLRTFHTSWYLIKRESSDPESYDPAILWVGHTMTHKWLLFQEVCWYSWLR